MTAGCVTPTFSMKRFDSTQVLCRLRRGGVDYTPFWQPYATAAPRKRMAHAFTTQKSALALQVLALM